MSDTGTQSWYKFQWLKEWGFSSIVTFLCFAAALTYVIDPIDPVRTTPNKEAASVTREADGADKGIADAGSTAAGTDTAAVDSLKGGGGQDKRAVSADRKKEVPNSRRAFEVFLFAAGAASLLWGVYAFTGDPYERRTEQVRFAYFFVIASFTVLAIPPLVKSQAIGNEPIGIISGCVRDARASEVLRCTSDADAVTDGATSEDFKNQWLVNIGGTLAAQTVQPTLEYGVACNNDLPQCKIGSSRNRAFVTGGLVVPLPFIIIALFGGAISLSRRVPEIQKFSDPKYIGTSTEPTLQASVVRERLAFQILQYISAPLIAIVAYQVIQPDSIATSAGLAFMSGFGSESILLLIRGVVEGVKPRIGMPMPAGAISGIVTDAGVPASDIDVGIIGSAIKTKTNTEGRYSLRDVPIGTRDVIAENETRSAKVTVSVREGGTENCDISLEKKVAANGASVNIVDASEENASTIDNRTADFVGETVPSITARLAVDIDSVDAGTLRFTIDGASVEIPEDGLIELPLTIGQAHQLIAVAQRNGKDVRGELKLTPTLADEDKPITLPLT